MMQKVATSLLTQQLLGQLRREAGSINCSPLRCCGNKSAALVQQVAPAEAAWRQDPRVPAVQNTRKTASPPDAGLLTWMSSLNTKWWLR